MECVKFLKEITAHKELVKKVDTREIEVTDEDKKAAIQLKEEGNTLFGK
jgi:hypothetical protein